MSRSAVVLWEDQLGRRKGFGPADLLAACVADVVGQSRWQVQGAIDSIPKKGNGNVLRACREDVLDLAPAGQPVFAVFDRDKAARLLGLPGKASDQRIIDAFAAECPHPQLRIILLKDNVESLLKAAQACGAEGSAGEWDGAIAGKEHTCRDTLLSRVAFGHVKVRNCVKQRVASFEDLVLGVARVFAGKPVVAKGSPPH